MAETFLETLKDGPNLIRGPIKMVDENGNEALIEKAWIALCRCGQSSKKPLCDGTHSKVGFKAAGANFYKP